MLPGQCWVCCISISACAALHTGYLDQIRAKHMVTQLIFFFHSSSPINNKKGLFVYRTHIELHIFHSVIQEQASLHSWTVLIWISNNKVAFWRNTTFHSFLQIAQDAVSTTPMQHLFAVSGTLDEKYGLVKVSKEEMWHFTGNPCGAQVGHPCTNIHSVVGSMQDAKW